MGNDNDWSGGFGEILRNLMNGKQRQQSFVPDLNVDAYKGAMGATGNDAMYSANPLFNQGGQAGGGGYEPGFMDKMTGYTDAEGLQHNGWGGLALGAGQGIMGGWMGMQQLNQAKDQLGESKRQFNKNFEANRSTTNTRLEDRQKARVASNAGAYESVGNYMNKNKV